MGHFAGLPLCGRELRAKSNVASIWPPRALTDGGDHTEIMIFSAQDFIWFLALVDLAQLSCDYCTIITIVKVFSATQGTDRWGRPHRNYDLLG